jgi:hypothetical protein
MIAKRGRALVNNRSPCLQNGGQLVLPGSTAPHTPHGIWPLELCVARRTYTCVQIFKMQAKTGSECVNNRSPGLQNGGQLVLPCSTAPHTPHDTWPLELCVAKRTYTCFQIFRMLAKTGSALVNNRSPSLQNGGQLVLPGSTAPHTPHDTWPLELCVARRTYTCSRIFKKQEKQGAHSLITARQVCRMVAYWSCLVALLHILHMALGH